jgi:phosphatidylserine decarboxylase
MRIRPEVIPFVVASCAAGILVGMGTKMLSGSWHAAFVLGGGVTLFFCAYFFYFFRDPDRRPPADSSAIVAGADGTVAAITEFHENKYLKTNCIRISIFLSLFDVHVNRAPISGKSTFLGYFPGKRFFTFQDKSSDLNQHNKILIEGKHTRCLVNQIVGPVCRRVVYWPDHDKAVDVTRGERIGMMKFGSRLDIYFPKEDVNILIKKGDKVEAGETLIGHVIAENRQNKQ